MTTLQVGLEEHGYQHDERMLTSLVVKLQASGFEFVEDLGGLQASIIENLDVSLVDCFPETCRRSSFSKNQRGSKFEKNCKRGCAIAASPCVEACGGGVE
jgi:hypothetical protein